MQWRDPQLFWLLPGVLALGAVLVMRLRRRAAGLAPFVEATLAARLTPDLDRRRPLWRLALRLFALGLIALALAGPKWGFHWQEVRREGIDILVALDTSRSMLATDVKPNRLERAKLAILDVLPLLQGDRIGLVAFAGSAFLECPLTLDYAAFERSLRDTQVGIIPRGGTAVARAIDTSLEGFEARQGRYEALILITDGEDHEGDTEAAAKRAAELGVKIFTVGIGTAAGELLPLGAEGFVKDRSGQVVKSRLNDAALTEIARITGGAYVQGLGPSLGLDQVFHDHIATMERREVASALERRYEERFQLPLLAALLLLGVEALVPLRRMARPARVGARRRWWPGRNAPAPLAALLLCVPFLTGWLDPPADQAAEGNQRYAEGEYEAAASKYGEGLIDAPGSPLLQFNLAAALYKQGKYTEAIAALDKVAANGDPTWTARAAYNSANASYRLGAATETSDPQAAIAAWETALVQYKRAMVADPADIDAKFNHEFVSVRIEGLKKKLEEERKKREEQQQEQEQEPPSPQSEPPQQSEQPQEQPPAQPEQQQQASQPEEHQGGEPSEQAAQEEPDAQRSESQEQPGQGENPPSPQGEEEAAQPGAQPGGGALASEDAPGQAEQQAARAVLDTARGEELGARDIERPVGVTGLGEPARDW